MTGAVATLVALTLLAAACGQKPGVRDQVALDDGTVAPQQQPAEGGADADGRPVDEDEDGGGRDVADDAVEFEDAEPADEASGETTQPEEPAGADAGDGQRSEGGQSGQADAETGGQSDGAEQTQGDDQAAQEQSQRTRGSDRTGVSEDTVRIAAHAPVTGAAPLPAPAFEEASDLYYRWYVEAQGNEILGGREVEVTFANDQYQPSTAAQACRQLIQSHFMLFGAGGTDQIQQCGRIAEQGGAPYFSAGVTEAGLRGNDWYFALSMSYRAQGELLADYVASQYSGETVAAVVTDTDNFDDAVEGWESGVQRQGIDYYRTLRHPRGDTSWYNGFARELAQNDVDVVYVLVAPVDYLRFAQQGAEQGFEPQFVGVGITMALNPLLDAGCPELDGGEFFHPYPALDWVRQNDAAFFEASERFGTEANDIAYGIWAQSQQVVEMFEQYEAELGTDLTREDFRDFVAQAAIESRAFPTVRYSPDDRFGASSVHLLRADCGRGEHVTVDTFVDGF